MGEMTDKDMLEATGQIMRKETGREVGKAREPIREDLAEVKERATKMELSLENDVKKTASVAR